MKTEKKPMSFEIKTCLGAASILLNAAWVDPVAAVEGGIGAYLLGSRDSFAGIVPGPGQYFGIDVINLQGDVQGLSVGGLPIRADTDLNLNLLKLSYTYVFDAALWGGTPAVNLNIPFLDASLSYVAVTPPLAGASIEDTTSGIGDITITPMVGWHQQKLHYSLGMSVFVPTGSYDLATVDVPSRTIDALSNGKNVWSFQPVISGTYFDPGTGFEVSGAASLLFSTRNEATDYQTAPAFMLEAAALQHFKSGWAAGLTGYTYQQLDDDSGSGAAATRAALGAQSLKAQVSGLGPIVTFSGGNVFGKSANFKLKYITEFDSKRRFESNTLWFNMTLTF